MPGVTQEQIAAARRMSAIEFLQKYRPNSLVKSSARGEYQLAEHDSFKINAESSVWHWKSRDIGGKSALNYMIYVEGVPFVEAVRLLCEESPMYIPVQHEAVERERPPFKLPRKAPTNDRVTRYLLGRGISLPTIRYCIERKILYESAEYHNCVFLGKDPQGVPKYAALRGIYDYGKPFKREAPGSQKQYGFCIPPMQPGTTVAVFEAAIDAMAEMTLCGDAADKYRLSLGGVSSSGKEPLALQEFLRQHPEITTIELRLDNDAKGRMASVGIRKIYADRYTVHDILAKNNPADRIRLDELVELMLDTVCSKRSSIRIAGDEFPTEVVKSRFLKLEAQHIQYVLDSLKDNPPHIRNIKKYLLAALYNAPLTIENYYAAQINHDLYGRNRGDVNWK